MGPLVGLGHNIDLLNAPEFVDLPGQAVLPRPLVRGPWRALFWSRIFVVLAFEPERFVAPSELQETEDLLECFAVDAISLALVARRGHHVDLLRHLAQPAILIPAGKAHKGAA